MMSDRDHLARAWLLFGRYSLGRSQCFALAGRPAITDFVLEFPLRDRWINLECMDDNFNSVTSSDKLSDSPDVLVLLNEFLDKTRRTVRAGDINLTVYLRVLWRGRWHALTVVVEMEVDGNRHTSHYDDQVLMEMAMDAVTGVSVSVPPILDYLIDHDPRVANNLKL